MALTIPSDINNLSLRIPAPPSEMSQGQASDETGPWVIHVNCIAAQA